MNTSYWCTAGRDRPSRQRKYACVGRQLLLAVIEGVRLR
jgi:hypothetical protein